MPQANCPAAVAPERTSHLRTMVFATPFGIVMPVPSRVKLVLEAEEVVGLTTFPPVVTAVEPS